MPGRVLIADPNLERSTNLENLLRKQNYEVDKIDDGNLVLTKVCEFQPHILILSVKMPGILGYDICSEIKNNTDLKDTTVILTFSENDNFDYQKARSVGATRFLPNSVEPSLLVSLLTFICVDNPMIKYSKSLSDNHSTQPNIQSNRVDEEDFESEEDLPEIDMSIEIEPFDEVDVYDMDEGEIETIEVEASEEVIYQFEGEGTEITEEIEELEAIEDAEEVKEIEEIEEVEEIEKFEETKELMETPPLELNINSRDKEIELPGLELPKSGTARLKLVLGTDTLGQVFEPPIVGDHFEYTEDLEDPLQVKHELNSISCRECGSTVLTEDVFCVECGAAVDESAVQVPSELSCSACRQMINLGDVFCLNCGAVQ